MFSTKLKNERFSANCILLADTPKIVQFVLDSGAKYTCCRYDFVDASLKETMMLGAETKLLGGFVAGEVMRFYKYPLKQLTIGNIDLGAKDIWITFDSRISDRLIGMDILKQIIYLNDPSDEKMILFVDWSELKEYVTGY